jgi:hypothetical protein
LKNLVADRKVMINYKREPGTKRRTLKKYLLRLA